ncbi:phage holin family protein [Escherichia coli]|nr:phage holin family protein [Escherichia coli]
MESSLAGIVNVWLCLAIVLGLFVYRRHGAAHKPMITWLAYWLMLGYLGATECRLLTMLTWVMRTP